jgi:hypothetical protein
MQRLLLVSVETARQAHQDPGRLRHRRWGRFSPGEAVGFSSALASPRYGTTTWADRGWIRPAAIGHSRPFQCPTHAERPQFAEIAAMPLDRRNALTCTALAPVQEIWPTTEVLATPMTRSPMIGNPQDSRNAADERASSPSLGQHSLRTTCRCAARRRTPNCSPSRSERVRTPARPARHRREPGTWPTNSEVLACGNATPAARVAHTLLTPRAGFASLPSGASRAQTAPQSGAA